MKGRKVMKEISHYLPLIQVKTYYVEALHCNLYHLYIDGVFENAYTSKLDVEERVNLITIGFIKVLDDVN